MLIVKSMEGHMITIMPESNEECLIVTATQKLTADDYEQVFIPALNKMLEHHVKIKVVINLDENFNGWEVGAIWDDAKFAIQHRNDFAKVALVGGPKWVTWGTKISAHFVSGQVQTFEASEFQKAIEWLDE